MRQAKTQENHLSGKYNNLKLNTGFRLSNLSRIYRIPTNLLDVLRHVNIVDFHKRIKVLQAVVFVQMHPRRRPMMVFSATNETLIFGWIMTSAQMLHHVRFPFEHLVTAGTLQRRW